MKLYLANGTYVGTQADAKSITKNFEQVEVPTDKEGLILFLNREVRGLVPIDQFDPDGAHADRVVKDVNEDIDETLRVAIPAPAGSVRTAFYADHTMALDDAFAAAPLAHRLTLASLALEDARDLCPTLVAQPAPLKPTVAEDELDPFA